MGALFSSATDLLELGSASDIDNLFAGTGDTIMCWIRLNGYGGSSTGLIMDKANTSTTAGWKLSVTDTGDRLNFFQELDTFFFGEWVSPVDSIELNTWYHVAVKYDRDSDTNDPVIFIDGQSVTVTELEDPFGGRNSDAANRLTIGGRPSGGREFDGIIWDARIYSGLMDDALISTIYAARGRDCVVDNLVRRFPLSPVRPGLGLNSPYVDHTEQELADSLTISVAVPDHMDGDKLTMYISWGGTSTTAPNITTPVGWASRLHLDLPSTATRPVMAIYTRIASSEPASYTVTANQTTPVGAFMVSERNIASEVPQDVATATGTSASPSSPTATPGSNAVVWRYVCIDNEAVIPTIPRDLFPIGIRRRAVLAIGNGSENGIVLAIGEESNDGAATGAKTWSPSASEEWGGATVTWLHGDGLEGLPVRDVSPAKADGETWGSVVGAFDISEGC